MREKKFTPGPWAQSQPQSATIYIDARLRGSTMQEIASCGPTETPEQRQANAHLIASAPLLLQALEDVVEYLRGEGDPTSIGLALEQAEAVIAKAYGEKP